MTEASSSIFVVIYFLFIIGSLSLSLYIAFRIIRAIERIASSLERQEQNKQKSNPEY
jgi:hypothetical protein